jgi:hypothetical protein
MDSIRFSMCWLPQDKRLLISVNCGDWIDVHTTGETWYTWYICFPCQSTYTTRMLSVGSSHMWQPFCGVINRIELDHCSWEKGLSSWYTARRLIDLLVHHNFFPSTTIEAVEGKPSIYWRWAILVYWTHISSMWSVRSILAHGGQLIGLYLTQTEGYHLGGLGFPHHSLCPFQPRVLRFPLRILSGLKLTFSAQTFSN